MGSRARRWSRDGEAGYQTITHVSRVAGSGDPGLVRGPGHGVQARGGGRRDQGGELQSRRLHVSTRPDADGNQGVCVCVCVCVCIHKRECGGCICVLVLVCMCLWH